MSSERAQRLARAFALVVVCTVCMWPVDGTVPTVGLDRAWSAGLSLARAKGLTFGDDLVFTYGPLGHAYFPSSITRSGLVISLVQIATICTLFIALSHRLLRLNNGRGRFALAGAFFLVLLGPGSGAALGDVAVFAVLATLIDASARRRELAAWWYPALGAASAGLMLGKVSTGIVTMVAVAVFVATGTARGRRIARTVAAYVITLVGLWVLTGQSLVELPTWFRGVVEISSGYSWAMGREEAGRSWELLVVAIVAVALVGAGVRSVMRRRRLTAEQRTPWPDLIATGAISFLLFEFAFKEGFVRHDIHSGLFFFALVYAATVLPRWTSLPRDAWAPAVGWLCAVLCLFSAGGVTFSAALDPVPSAQSFGRVVNDLIDPGAWRDELTAARAAARDSYQVPAAMLTAMQGASVHVDPFELMVAWAYDLRWNPTPVFQRYSAYTPSLDELNADHLAATAGPDQVLRSTEPAIDGRFDFLEAPRTMRTMLCRFAPIEQSDRWQLLARVTDRCGAPRVIGTQRFTAGEVVTVPTFDAARQALLIRIDFELGIVESLRSAVYKSQEYTLTVDGVPSRVLPRMTPEPGLLYIPPSAGWADPFRRLTAAPTELRLDHSAVVSFAVIDVAAP